MKEFVYRNRKRSYMVGYDANGHVFLRIDSINDTSYYENQVDALLRGIAPIFASDYGHDELKIIRRRIEDRIRKDDRAIAASAALLDIE